MESPTKLMTSFKPSVSPSIEENTQLDSPSLCDKSSNNIPALYSQWTHTFVDIKRKRQQTLKFQTVVKAIFSIFRSLRGKTCVIKGRFSFEWRLKFKREPRCFIWAHDQRVKPTEKKEMVDAIYSRSKLHIM